MKERGEKWGERVRLEKWETRVGTPTFGIERKGVLTSETIIQKGKKPEKNERQVGKGKTPDRKKEREKGGSFSVRQ